MRILWEGPVYRPLSLDKINRNLCLQGLAHGHEVIVRPTEPASPDTPPDDGSLAKIKAILGGYEPADWHVRHMWPPYWSNRCGPLILNQPWEFGAVPDQWIDPIKNRVAKLIVPSHAVQEMFLESGIPQEKITIIPNGVDPSIYHPYGPTVALPLQRKTVFLWVGGFLPRKGLDILIKAYLKAFHKNDDVLLLIKAVGLNSAYKDAPFPPELLDAQNNPNAPLINVIRQDLDEMQMAGLYRSVTALISPYRGEGFNLPVLEAMTTGCLVAASDTNPTNEFVPEHVGWRIPGTRQYSAVEYSTKPGWQFEPNLEGLIDVLRTIANLSRDERNRRSEAGRHWALQHYSWERIWQGWEAVLQDPPVKNHWFLASPPPKHIIWHGPIRNASGYAAESRAFLKALPATGILPRIIDASGMEKDSVTPEEETFLRALEQIPVSRNTLAIHSVPAWGAIRRRQGVDLVRTMFETNAIPEEWPKILNHFPGVIVPSQFNRNTFIESGIPEDKIFITPSPVNTDLYRPPTNPKPGNRLKFISIFDWIDRKGWDALIKAWISAFTPNDPVQLVIKTTRIANQTADPRQSIVKLIESQGYHIDHIAPIQVIIEQWTEPQIVAFYQAADVFVLPTRGEGWGRPILEAMATGLLVIATDWSGQTDYLNADNALPLKTKGIRPVPTNTDMAVLKGQMWAEPDVDHLIELLRWSRDHFSHTENIRRQARLTAESYHPTKVITQLLEVLAQFGIQV